MFFTRKLIIPLTVFIGAVFTTSGTTIKRDLISLPRFGLEFLQLGNFGPISKLPTHPAFAHLRLTPQQSIGFMQVLLENGFLSPNVLKLANGRPLLPVPQPYFGAGGFFGAPAIDPYFFYTLSNYPKYLPFGLGPQGIYGTTGLPNIKPLGPLKYEDKN